jgi:hypothetical protein
MWATENTPFKVMQKYLDFCSRYSVGSNAIVLYYIYGSLLAADLCQPKVYCFDCVCERINLSSALLTIIIIAIPILC